MTSYKITWKGEHGIVNFQTSDKPLSEFVFQDLKNNWMDQKRSGFIKIETHHER